MRRHVGRVTLERPAVLISVNLCQKILLARPIPRTRTKSAVHRGRHFEFRSTSSAPWQTGSGPLPKVSGSRRSCRHRSFCRSIPNRAGRHFRVVGHVIEGVGAFYIGFVITVKTRGRCVRNLAEGGNFMRKRMKFRSVKGSKNWWRLYTPSSNCLQLIPLSGNIHSESGELNGLVSERGSVSQTMGMWFVGTRSSVPINSDTNILY